MKALKSTIADHPFLKGLSPAHLQVMTDCAMRCHFDAGQLIFEEGEMANRFYLIETGKVALVTSTFGEPHRIQVIGAGDVLGWSWLFPPYCWHFNARAVEASDAIFFYGTRLREACETDHDLGYEIMKRMTEIIIKRLHATRYELISARHGGRPIYTDSIQNFVPAHLRSAEIEESYKGEV